MNDFQRGALGVGIAVLTVLGLIFYFSTCVIISPGERGVKVTLGKISPNTYVEGFHFITPFISQMQIFDVKTQKMSPATTVFTKDIQQARLAYVVNYNLIPADVAKVYKDVGRDYKDKIILPVVNR